MRLVGIALSVVVATGIGLVVFGQAAAPVKPSDWSKYRSPFDVAFSPDGKMLAVSDRTARKLVLLDAGGKVTKEVPLEGEATGLVWKCTGESVFVSEIVDRESR